MFEFKWSRLLAVAERDLRRFRRNTTLMIPMALMPIIYLVILGKAMGGDLHGLRVALVDEDHGPAAVVVHDRLITLQQSRNLFRVVHEGYFVTPLSSLDMVGGLTLSATTLAMIIGTIVLGSSILIARLPVIGGVKTIALTLLAILLLALGLILFMFTLMARVSNPLTPRALFGILNVLTFFPSGALYPTESYPGWLNAISAAFPMRYAVHALRNLLLKGVGFQAVLPDFLVIAGFALVLLVLPAQ